MPRACVQELMIIRSLLPHMEKLGSGPVQLAGDCWLSVLISA
jgi:hypothetical protein